MSQGSQCGRERIQQQPVDSAGSAEWRFVRTMRRHACATPDVGLSQGSERAALRWLSAYEAKPVPHPGGSLARRAVDPRRSHQLADLDSVEAAGERLVWGA